MPIMVFSCFVAITTVFLLAESFFKKPRFVEYRILPGWKGSLPFYRFTCEKHGEVENYPQGHEQVLRCPLCDKEEKSKTQTIYRCL